jgi:hypothetical protein
MEHVKYKHSCNSPFCQFCDGGLFACVVCGGFEGSLPTDCPGEKMGEAREEEVYAGAIDFREGKGWVAPDGTGSSMGDMDVKFPRRVTE